MSSAEKNPTKNIYAVIPARLFSTRLPNKLLLSLNGKPLILHTLEQAKKVEKINRVIVATDSEEILRVVEASGNEAILTDKDHQSGSDRIAEIAENLPENAVIVNVQGDEPMIPPSTIEAALEAFLSDESIDIATTCEPISDAHDILSSDVVKVVTDENDFALYFSRSPIPFPREAVQRYGSLENALKNESNLFSLYRKHTGLYIYRREFLLKYTKAKQTKLEKTEMLEQLRALENGARIKVVEVSESSIGVDTREDFERVQEIIEKMSEIKYRKARIEDVPQVAKVHVESWQKSFAGIVSKNFLNKMSVEKRTKRMRERFSKENYQMFVAENSNGEIVGFADFGEARNKDFGFDAELYAIYFLPEYQRRGIGGKLFQFGADYLRRKNYHSMYLEVLKVSPYKDFYDKMGGKIIGQSNHDLDDKNFETLIYGWENLDKI